MSKAEQCCDRFPSLVADRRVPVTYSPRYRGRALMLQEPDEETANGWKRATSPQQQIIFCPFCGLRFAEDLGHQWFDTLLDMGFEEPYQDDIPEEFRSDRWWKERGL